ncbi:hypothetical protein [Polaribacter tangerinus]|uniref:hypothetical protein n=1 Tax=Polaribacter tangerinus TaxID=1920034 RepID=UPI000B4B5C3E|nr:hypothetical protein [Polaribacter tangerinus]
MKEVITEVEQLTLNSASRKFLKETAMWSKFLSILGIIMLALMFVGSFFISAIYSSLPQTETIPFNIGGVLSVVYIVIALIYAFPVYYLYQFSVKTSAALSSKDDETLSKALEMLKSHYKFIGVYTIIILSIYLLAAIIGIIGAVATAV